MCLAVQILALISGSSSRDLQFFAAEYEVSGMRIRTSKSEAKVKGCNACSRLGVRSCHKYHGVLFK